MALSETEKTEIRRFCGYGVIGDQAPNNYTSYRFFTAYGTLEYRMQHFSDSEEAVVRDLYLTNLRLLEQDQFTARENLDTKQAAVWHWNPNEIRDRKKLYDEWRRQLCSFINIPTGPGLSPTGGIRIVV